MGTGFFVTRQHVITCAHVAAADCETWREARESGQWAKGLRIETTVGTYVPTSVVYHATEDLAILVLESPLDIEPVELLRGAGKAFFERLRTSKTPTRICGFNDGVFVEKQLYGRDLLPNDYRLDETLGSSQTSGGNRHGLSGSPWLATLKSRSFCIGMVYLGGEGAATSVLCRVGTIVDFLQLHVPNVPTLSTPNRYTWQWVSALILGIGLAASVTYWVCGSARNPTILVMSGSVFNWLQGIGWHDGIPGIRGIPKGAKQNEGKAKNPCEVSDNVQSELDPSTVMLDVGSKDALNVISRTYRHGNSTPAWTAAPVAAMGVGIPEIMVDSVNRKTTFAWLPLFKTHLLLYVEKEFLRNCAAATKQIAFDMLNRLPKGNEKAARIELGEFWQLVDTCEVTSSDNEHKVHAVYVPSETSGTIERLNIALAKAGQRIIPKPDLTWREVARAGIEQMQSVRDGKQPKWIVWTLDFCEFSRNDRIEQVFGKRMLIANDTSPTKPPEDKYQTFFFTHKGEAVDEDGWALVPVNQDTTNYVMPDNLANVLESIRASANRNQDTRGSLHFCWAKDLVASRGVGTWGNLGRLSRRTAGWNYKLTPAEDPSILETGQETGWFVVPSGCVSQARELEELIRLNKAQKRMSRIDALYLDMDNTLLTREPQHILPESRDALRAFQTCGGHIGVASGRIPDQVEEYLGELRPDLPAVLFNGGLMLTPPGNAGGEWTPTRVIPLSSNASREAADVLRRVLRGELPVQMPHVLVQYTNGDTLASGNAAIGNVREFAKKANIPDKRVRDCEFESIVRQLEDGGAPPMKIVLVSGSKVDAKKLLSHLKSLLKASRPVLSDPERCVVEIVPLDVNKANAIRDALNRCKIDPQSVATFGDSENDVEMLREFGLGVAMANGIPSAKAAAHLVIGRDEPGYPKANDTPVIAETVRSLMVLGKVDCSTMNVRPALDCRLNPDSAKTSRTQAAGSQRQSHR